MEQYFASKPSIELAHDIIKKIEAWSTTMTRNGLKARWMKAYRMYYGRHWKGDPSYRDSEILFTGEDGEFSALTVNDFRNLIKHMLVLTTNQKPAYDPRATNTDDKTNKQTRLAKNILDYYTREKRLGRYLKMAAEMALVMGKGFVKITWDKQAGKAAAVQDYQVDGEDKKRLVYEGDVYCRMLDPFAVLVDQSLEDWTRRDWEITREWVNRYDVIARHPEQADQIMNIPTKKDLQGFNFITVKEIDDTDLIAEYELYHKRTPSMPNGRYQKMYSPEVIEYDGAIPYNGLTVFRIVPGQYYGTTEGYTEAFDIMNLQQAQNVLYSAFYTNQSTFGVQNILYPEGCNVTPFQLAQSLRAIKYNPAAGKPEALQLCATPPELFKGLELIGSKMETVFGMNSVARGNVQEELSGKAMGLLQSMAIQYASGFQESYAELSEDVATFILSLIKSFAKTKRIMSVVGKFNKADVMEFTGEDISDIDRVVVDLGNPLSKTLAGRLDIGQQLIEKGLIQNAQQYLTLLETGNLEVLTEHETSKLSLLRSENEKLQEWEGPTPEQIQMYQQQSFQAAQMGQPPPLSPTPVVAMQFDPHVLHMQEHACLISRPEVRLNSVLTQAVLAHIEDHKRLYISLGMDPQLAQLYSLITGEPPPPPPPMMMGPMGPMGPGGPPPGGPPPKGKGNGKPLLKQNSLVPGPQQNVNPPPDMMEPPLPPQPDQALQEALK